MSFQMQPGAEGSLSESVHFPPTSSFLEHQGYHVDGRMAMAPLLSSASRAPSRPPFLHDDGRGGSHYMHNGGFDRPQYDYALRRHSCGDHLGLHSGTLIEHLLLQENQKALRMASLVQSQASGCLSGCLSCGLSEKRLRFKDSEERMVEEQRCYSRNVGEGSSRPVNLVAEADTVECSDGWFRQPRPRHSIGAGGERNQSRISYSEEEHGRSLCQGRRTSYPVPHPVISHSKASNHVQDHHLRSVGASESSVPIYGFNDADDGVRQRWSTQRQTHSENGTEEDGRQRATKSVSRVEPGSARDQGRLSLPGTATGSLSRGLVGSPHRPAVDSSCAPQSTRTTSQSPLGIPENSVEPSYQDNSLQQASTPRVVTQGPVSLTNWYIMKVQTVEVGRVMEMKIAVGGWIVQNREHVKTCPILSRLDIHNVLTEDGVEVILEGSMDQEASTANGFSPGIVQCLSAGFPYMWKQLLRVRPVGESSGLAVCESLGGLHPKASKCLSEDDSQADVIEERSVLQTSVNITSDAVEAEAAVAARAERSGAVERGKAVTARAETSDAVEAQAAAVARAETSDAVETQAAIAARAERSGAVETEIAVTARAVTSGAVVTQAAVVARAETSDAVEAQAAVAARAERSGAVEKEIAVTARAETSDAIDECCPHGVLLQQTYDAGPTSLDPVPVTEAPVEYVTTDSLAKEPEGGLTVETTAITIRRGRKNKKAPAQPVRSSRRLRQRQARSGEFPLPLVDSSVPDQTEHVISGMEIDKSGEEEPAEILPDAEQAPTGREEPTITNIIEDVLKDLQQSDVEAVDQDFMGAVADSQSNEVEELGLAQDHCENLSKGSDGVEVPELKEIEATDDGFKSGEIEETVSLASPELEIEETEESGPVTPPELLQSKVQSRVNNLDKSKSGGMPRAREARVFPEYSPRLTRSLKRKLRLSSVTEAVADIASATRSLNRLRRFSDIEAPSVEPTPNADTIHQEEGPSVEPVSDPDTIYQVKGPRVEPISNPNSPHGEVATFHVRERNHNTRGTKAVSCSKCNQPCSPHDLLKYKNNVFSPEATPEHMVERVPKVEQEEFAPLVSQPTAETSGAIKQPNKDRTESCSMRRRSGRLKKMKSSTWPAKRGTTRRLMLEDSGRASSEDLDPVPSKQKIRRTSTILPPPLPPPRVQDKSKVPEAFGLKTSRSGRLLVPPLAYWRSQSIEYDKDGGIIAIFDGFQAKPADTGCFNFTPPQEKHAKKIQEKLCKAAATIKSGSKLELGHWYGCR